MATAEHLLDLLQESVIVCESDGIIVAWNAASTRIYG
jgi:PAS domain-containing protein